MRDLKNSVERRKYLEKHLQIDLKNIGNFSLDEFAASTKNCEQMIGVAQIPIGIAGPLEVNSKNIYVPLSTTEGALVASVNRGCKAIRESGGAKVFVEKVGATRGPVFKIKDFKEGQMLDEFINKNFDKFKKISVNTSRHLRLKQVNGQVLGGYYFLRFIFDTGKAMGMNMVTIASQEISNYIELKTKIKCLSVSGNFCVDKKPNWQNFILGRGYKINAEIILTKKVLKDVLKTNAQKFFEVWLAKCMVGSMISGSMGGNAQIANVVAAIFIACGQDPAHIVEAGMGITTSEILGENLKVGVYLPDVMVGTVGGGTGLATQQEALSIIGKDNFVDAIGGAVLAGEISLLASLSEGSLVKAHRRLGRGEKI